MATPPKKPLPPALQAIAAIDPKAGFQRHTGHRHSVREMVFGVLATDDSANDDFLAGRITKAAALLRTERDLRQMARIFLGRDPAVTIIPGWNTGGGLAAHLRQVFAIPDASPEDAVKAPLRAMLVRTRTRRDHGIARRKAGLPVEPWDADAVIDAAADCLLGGRWREP